MILHKSQQPVATTSSSSAFCENSLPALHDIFGCLAQTNYPLLITAVVVAKSYVAPLSEDIDLK
jgi:hypothetical protein